MIIFNDDSQCKGTLVDGTKGSLLTLDMSLTRALSQAGDNFAMIYLRRLSGKLADGGFIVMITMMIHDGSTIYQRLVCA